MKTVTSGADFVNFTEGMEYCGKFLQPVLREQDSPTDPDKKKGDLMGFLFENPDGGNDIVGASHAIEKALTSEGNGAGCFYRITFLGKGENAKGQPFNRFKIEQFDDENEYREYITKK